MSDTPSAKMIADSRSHARSEWHYMVGGQYVCESFWIEVNCTSAHTAQNARTLAAKPSLNLHYKPTDEVCFRAPGARASLSQPHHLSHRFNLFAPWLALDRRGN